MTFSENENIPRPTIGHGLGQTGASLSDILTACQHIASNIAQLGQVMLNINGQQSRSGLTSAGGAQLLKNGPGRVAQVSVVVESGTASPATLVDSNNPAATAPVIYVAPAAIGLYTVNLPFNLGLVVIPGASDTITVSFS